MSDWLVETSKIPCLNVNDIKICFKVIMGIECPFCDKLTSRDSQTYKLKDSNGKQYVFKLFNSSHPAHFRLVESQYLLTQFAASRNILCPQLMKIKQGNIEKRHYILNFASGEDPRVGIVYEYINGFTVNEVAVTPVLCYKIGKYLAQFSKEISVYFNSYYSLYQSYKRLDKVVLIRDDFQQLVNFTEESFVSEILREYTSRFQRISTRLLRGLIHGDITESNIVVEEIEGAWQIKAVLDFCDCHQNILFFELVCTMASLLLYTREMIDAPYILGGYCEIRPLPELEFNLLKIAVAARMLQLIVHNAALLVKLSPQLKGSSITILEPQKWKFLKEFWALDETELLQKWKVAISNLDLNRIF